MAKIKNTDKKTLQTTANINTETVSTPASQPDFTWEIAEERFKKNQKWIVGGLAIVAISVASFFGFQYYKNTQQEEAAKKLYGTEYFLETDSLGKVLSGAGKISSAKKVADEYGITPAGKLANLYAGIALMREGKFKEAVGRLEGFNSDDKIIQARAYSLTGDAYMELNQLENAIGLYRKAANYYPNQSFTPTYLVKLALAYELKGDSKNAISAYDELIAEFYNSQERPNAQKYKARLESMLESK